MRLSNFVKRKLTGRLRSSYENSGVTQEDINNGTPRCSTGCAISLACSRVIPKFHSYALGNIYYGNRDVCGKLQVKKKFQCL